MFIIEVTYIKPIEEVDQHLDAHRTFLKGLCDSGTLITAGRQNPPIGGLILAKAENREAVQQIIEQDPFYKAQVAEYRVVEFTPRLYHADFASLV